MFFHGQDGGHFEAVTSSSRLSSVQSEFTVFVSARIFLTSVIEGEKLPGVKPPPHTLGGQPFVHPESVAAEPS